MQPHAPDPEIQAAARLLAGGRVPEALDRLSALAAAAPAYAAAHVLLARALEAAGRPEEALAAWHRAHFLVPTSPLVLRERQRLLDAGSSGAPLAYEVAPETSDPARPDVSAPSPPEAPVEAPPPVVVSPPTPEAPVAPVAWVGGHDESAAPPVEPAPRPTPDAPAQVEGAAPRAFGAEDAFGAEPVFARATPPAADPAAEPEETEPEEAEPVDVPESTAPEDADHAPDPESRPYNPWAVHFVDSDEEAAAEPATDEPDEGAPAAAYVEAADEVDGGVTEEAADEELADREEAERDSAHAPEPADWSTEDVSSAEEATDTAEAYPAPPTEEAATPVEDEGDPEAGPMPEAELIQAAPRDADETDNMDEEGEGWTLIEETDEPDDPPVEASPAEPIPADTYRAPDGPEAAYVDVEVPAPDAPAEVTPEDMYAGAEDASYVDVEAAEDAETPEPGEAPAPEAPADEAPVAEAPVEETPVEEAPSDDVADELDALIRSLSDAPRIRPDPDFRAPAPTPVEDEGELDDLVSETLARIYAAQRQYAEAAIVYEKLARQRPEDAEGFLQKAAELRARNEAPDR